MRAIFIRHVDVEHPGLLLPVMQHARWQHVVLDSQTTLEALQQHEANSELMVVLGGPMDVWDEKMHPWLRIEKELIRRWVKVSKKPYLGICLGHQLLADALGGRVERMSRAEVGVTQVQLTDAGSRDPIFKSMGPNMTCLQWHGAEVTQLPECSTVLAYNDRCRIQAFRYQDYAYGIQFHLEVTPTMVEAWTQIPEYESSAEGAIGVDGLKMLREKVRSQYSLFESSCSLLVGNLARSILRNA